MGDAHGLNNILFSLNNDKDKFLTDTVLIIAGDIGLGFNSPTIELSYLKEINDICITKNVHLILLRGNHDKPSIYNDIEQRSEYNIYSNVTVIPDYTIIRTMQENTLCIGGAISIDRTNRILDRSYWTDEVIPELTDALKEMLISVDFNIDIIVTHNAPTFCKPVNLSMYDQGEIVNNWTFYDNALLSDNWNDRFKLDELYEFITKKHNVKCWVYGHFHDHFQTENDGIQFIGLDMVFNKNVYISNRMCKYGPDCYKYTTDEFLSNVSFINI